MLQLYFIVTACQLPKGKIKKKKQAVAVRLGCACKYIRWCSSYTVRTHPFLTSVPCVYVLLSILNSDSGSLNRQMCVSLIWKQASEFQKLALGDIWMVRGLRVFREGWAFCTWSFLSHGYKLLWNKGNPVSFQWRRRKQWNFYKICVYRYICIYTLHISMYYICVYTYVHVLYAYIYIIFLVTCYSNYIIMGIFRWTRIAVFIILLNFCAY